MESTRNPSLNGKAIRCVRNLMTTHDLDARYTEPETRARVAVLYLPLLGIVMDTIPQLHSYLQETHDHLQNIGILDDYQGPQPSKINCKKSANCKCNLHVPFSGRYNNNDH